MKNIKLTWGQVFPKGAYLVEVKLWFDYKNYKGKNGKWYTYLPDKTQKQGRRKLKRTT